MDYIINIIGNNIIPIAGALIMASIGFYLAGRNNRLNRFANASANFRNAFLNELRGLYPLAVEWPKDSPAIDHILRKAFPSLQSAVTEFRNFLPWYKRYFFDKAWFRYCCSTGRKIDVQCYHHYMFFEDNPEYKETFRRNVENLLMYAKQT